MEGSLRFGKISPDSYVVLVVLMETAQKYPTVEDVLKYEDVLIDAVEKQVCAEPNPKSKAILLRLQAILKSRAVKSFIVLSIYYMSSNSLCLLSKRFKRWMTPPMN